MSEKDMTRSVSGSRSETPNACKTISVSIPIPIPILLPLDYNQMMFPSNSSDL